MPFSRIQLGQVLLYRLAFCSPHELSRAAGQLDCNYEVNGDTGCKVTLPT